MIPRLIYDFILFLLPFAIYGIYWRMVGRKQEGADTRVHPWTMLIAAGLVLVAISFVLWSLPKENTRDGVYVPPHLENGQVVPGRVEPGQTGPR